MLITGSFSSYIVGSAFQLREVGVMARIENEPDRLYSVANVLAETPDNIPAGGTVVIAFQIKIVIDRAPNVTIVLDIGEVTAVNIGPPSIGPGWFARKVASELEFKRAVEGIGIQLIETDETVTIGQKTLQLDLDLYVPISHPNAPNQNVAFPTIQEAHDYLLQYFIPVNRTATIHVAAGHFVIANPIRIHHPQGSQIRIIGAELASLTMNGASTQAGSAWNWTWTLPVVSSAGVNVGDYVSVRGGSNTWSEDWGHHVVRAVTPTSITIAVRNSLAPGLGGHTGAAIRVYKTFISCGQEGGFIITNGGIGLLENLSVVYDPGQAGGSTQLGTGLSVKDGASASVNKCGFSGHQFGIHTTDAGSNLVFSDSYVSNSSYCVYCDSGGRLLINGNSVVSAGGVNGVWCEVGGYISLGESTQIAVCQIGILCSTGQMIFASSTLIRNLDALLCTNQGAVRNPVANPCSFYQNITSDITASMLGLVGLTGTGATRFNPANRVLGPSGGFINWN